MRSVLTVIGSLALLGGVSSTSPVAQDKAKDPSNVPSTRRQVDERPFGGPPPNNRDLRTSGNRCKTPLRTCELKRQQPIDSRCTCWGARITRGRVVE
jgi:hypothetical protein